MQANHTKYSTLIEFEYTRASLRALSHMLSATMSQGDSLEQIALGVGRLFDTQNEALADIEEAVRAEYRRVDEAAHQATALPVNPQSMRTEFIAAKISEGYDAGDIANALNLKKETVEKVVRKLLGEDGAERATEPQKVING